MANFKTKARAVELLGKGQIADLPTAISELWKNGYDAYAKDLSCDLYIPGYKDINEPLFCLSDDGWGMNYEDIVSKWIVLGTDSKSRGMHNYTPEQTFGLPLRIPMGEKGIGRLSVAYLGSPMLMLTKKENEVCQAVFIDWRILENFNLFIDEVNIPCHAFNDGEDLNSLISKMKLEFLENFHSDSSSDLTWSGQEELREQIINDVSSFYIPDSLIKEFTNLFQGVSSHGTKFIIGNPNEQLLDLIGYSPLEVSSNSVLEIQRSLTGIFNVFKDIPDFSTSFNILTEAGKYNIISDFFDPEDFKYADHHIKGKIDENGMFNGSIRVFQKTYQYTFRPIRKPGKTPYGSFDLELGQMEGAPKASMLSEEQYDSITSKTEKYGGLYIYRDRFRVLPYGRTDYDFLRFEERRSKKAGYYFFSHRNMFGYISITRNGNPSLKDKAGREGLIENKAYKELKDDLIALFVDIAKNFLKSTDPDEVNARSEQLDAIRQRHHAILEAEKKRNRQTKANFTKLLKANQEKIRFIEQEIFSLQAELENKAELLNLTYEEYLKLSNSLLDKREKLRSLKLISPKRVSLSSTQERKFSEYQALYSSICDSFESCENAIAQMRKRFDVQNLKKDFENQYMYSLREISTLTNQYISRISTIADAHKVMLLNEGRGFTEQFKQMVSESIPPMNLLSEYEDAIKQVAMYREEIKTKIDNQFAPFVSHIESLSLDIDEEVILEWYQSKYHELEERLDATNELAQLGISAEIIDHELYSLHAQMANSLSYFKEYSRTHPETVSQYKQLSVAFEHMEANYKMLQPLYRTAKKQRAVFTGRHILESMCTFFSQRIKDLDVTIESTDDFDNYEFFTYESVIYSVFINIINNALYWLIPSPSRVIRIVYQQDTNEILIMNSGEKIDNKIINDIFTLFFTRKHNGRGIGLYLARQSLKSIGMDIYASNATEYNRLNGACFIIKLNSGIL